MFAPGASVTVRVPLRNVSDRPATAVVQGYVAPLDPPVRARAEGAPGVAEGGARCRRVGAPRRSSSRPRPSAAGTTPRTRWTVDPGPYELVIAASAADERARVKLTVSWRAEIRLERGRRSAPSRPRPTALGRRLDHHPHDRLGARRPHEHAPVVAELGLDLAHDRPERVGAASSPASSRTRTLLQHLRVLRDARPRAPRAAAPTAPSRRAAGCPTSGPSPVTA